MFSPKTSKITQLAQLYPERISELESILVETTNIYIDWANVIGWQEQLGWHIDAKRLYQFFRSFSSVDKIRWYFGTLNGDKRSQQDIAEKIHIGYEVSTKPVKIMTRSVDVSSLSDFSSRDILKSFLTRGLLTNLSGDNIRVINGELKKLNQNGITLIEEKKCNFDVEIGVDMILDHERSLQNDFYKVYVLWSGDSDFTDIVEKMINQGKTVFVFSTARRISTELSNSRAYVFDIQKIRNFICWNRDINIPLSN